MPLSVRTNQITGPAATGNVSYTDPGFTPKLLLQWNGLNTATGATADAQWSLGAANSAAGEISAGYNSKNALSTNSQAGRNFRQNRVGALATAGTATDNVVNDVVSFDTNGFTLAWTTLTTTSPLHNYLALGGSDITNAKVGSFASNTTTGNQSVTGVGFKPDIVFLFANLSTTAVNATNNNNYGFGVMTATDQWSMGQKTQHNQATKNTSRSFDNTSCLIIPSTTTDAVAHVVKYVSMDSDGFTVNIATSAGIANLNGYIAIKGGQWKVGTDTQPTTAGTKATTGVGFTPSLAIFGSACDTQAAGSSANSRLMLGATDGTRNVSLWTGDRDAVTTSNSSTIMSNNKCLVMATENGATPTTNAEASLSSFDSDGFTLNWTTADASARRFGYVMGGANPVVNDTGDFFAVL